MQKQRKKPWVEILVSDKPEFRERGTEQDTRKHGRILKGAAHGEDRS